MRDAAVMARIRERFDYAFQPPDAEHGAGGGRRSIRSRSRARSRSAVSQSGRSSRSTAALPSWGFRIGAFAYSPDVKELPEQALAALAGVEVWLVDCLRDRPHPTHAHLEQTLAWIDEIKPRRAVLTHMNHEFEYWDLQGTGCRPGVEPAYDGMVLKIPLCGP